VAPLPHPFLFLPPPPSPPQALLFLLQDMVHLVDLIVNIVLALIYAVAIAGFLYFGGRLFLMLRRFPIESTRRRSKLREVGWVTTVVSSCYAVRVAMLVYVSINEVVDTSPIFIGIFYFVVEIVPSALVLYVLRKLPPRERGATAARPPFAGTQQQYTAASEDRRVPLLG
jgi:THH1/TOM1/TOM3 domain